MERKSFNVGVFLWYFCATFSMGCGFKILFLPNMYPSVHLYMTNLAETAVKAGHDVSFALPTSARDAIVESTKKNGINIIPFKSDEKNMFDNKTWSKQLLEGFIGHDEEKIKGVMQEYIRFESKHSHDMLNDHEFVAFLNETKFDMIMVNVWDVFINPIIMAYKLSVPFIQVHSLFAPCGHRIPALPSFAPSLYCVDCTEKMTFWQRLENAYLYYTMITQVQPEMQFFDREWRLHFPTITPPSKNEVLNSAAMTINNIDPILTYPFPSMPNNIYIGGLSLKPVNQLDGTFEQLLNSFDEEFIVVSFGSSLSYLDEKHINKLLQVFKQVNYIFLLKYNIDKSKVTLPDNVKAFKWLPQNDLLAHPKVKLFITHCGNNGQMEAFFHKVPMLGMPIFADQHFNAVRMEYHGFGRRFNLMMDSPDRIVFLIKEVLVNDTYRINIAKASQIYRDIYKLHSPQETAVYWIEHVIKFGSKHLRSYGQDMPLYQFWMLDILLFCLILVVICVIVIMAISYLLFRCASTAWMKKKVKAE